MDDFHSPLTPEVIQMLISSVTDHGNASLSGIQAERLLNAIARAQSGVPTAVQNPNGQTDR
jgi:hypothetical protein